MGAIIWAALAWLMRAVVIKFVVLTAVVAVVAFLVPLVVGWIAPFLLPTSLTSAFSAVPSSVWFFLDFFRLDFGLPLLISAVVTRFLIRRLPVIG